MKSAKFWVAGTGLLLCSGSVIAQQSQGPAVTLPGITVEAKKASPRQKAAPNGSVTKASPATAVPGPIEGPPAETALGPVSGYVAERTATGSKTDTPILEVPRTVNVITRDQIEAQQPQSLKEALSYTPNVQNQTGSSSILDNIAVRGFTAPIFLDGLLLPTDGAIGFARIRLEPYGLERLEVLKGPASGLFGQSPPGGLINAISKRPQDDPHNEVFLQFGTNNHRATGFDFTGPLTSSGDVAYRFVGLARDTDLDFDFADRQRFFLAPSLKWRISGDTMLTILGSVQRDGGFGPHQFVPLSLTNSSAPLGRISRKTYLGEPGFDDYTEDQWQLGYSLEHRFNSAIQFRQNVRYSESDQDIDAMRAGAAIGQSVSRSANIVRADVQGTAIDNQLQADFTTRALKHRVLAGLDYRHVDSGSGFWVGSAPPINAYNPVYGSPFPNPFATPPLVLSDGTLQQVGVYLQDQVKLGRWIATLGLRHDWSTTELDDNRSIAPVPHQRMDDDAWTGNVGLSYVFDSGLAPYVSYSTSFQPATGSSLIDAVTGQPLKPTTGEGYEAGIKYQPPGSRTLITAAVFQITQENVSTSLLGTPGLVTQTGEVRMRGFEIEGKTSLNRNLDVIAGYGYVEPIITDTLLPSNVGNDLQQVSRHTASAWGVYTWHEGALASFALGVGVRYVGSQYAEVANTNKLSDYTLVDAMASYDLTNVGLNGTKLQVNAYNLFDTYYVATCLGAPFCQLGQSRSVIATLKYEW